MDALTYSTVALTLGLVVARPRLGARFRVSPALAALAGVALLAAFGSVRLGDLGWAARTMWRPLLGIVAIMAMTGVARRLGVLSALAALVFDRARGSATRLFLLVFVFGATTSAVLNNDSAILLVTPLVVEAAKKQSPKLVVPLAFAVFLSAGVAPLVVSNPMNMVVASYAGIGFNEYAARMSLPSLVGYAITLVMLVVVFGRDLARTGPVSPPAAEQPALDRMQRSALAVLAIVVLAYPVVSWFGGPVWVVAVAGALVLLMIAARVGHGPATVVRQEIHLDTLVFLVAALILSIGLRNVGVVDRLAHAYAGASPAKIGAIAAVGSAVLNNHPMSHLNMFALAQAGGGHSSVLAALVGGDLGPRLLPMGSLAGLLWLEMLRRADVEVPVLRFFVIGAVVTLPTLAACLMLL